MFRTLLGGPPSDWELEAASLRALTVEFRVVNGPSRLELTARRGAEGGVRLSCDGPDDELSEEERALLGAMEESAAGTAFADLVAALSRDSLHYSDPKGSSAPSRFERYYRTVDHRADFWKFVYPQARFLEQEIGFGVRYAKVSHATLECRLNNPQLSVAPLRFFADEARPRSERDDSSYTDTDLREADVVGGRTQAILSEALERVARDEKPAFIHLKTTCLPELVGDNPSAAIARLAERGVPVLWTSKTRDPGSAYEDMVERMLDRADFTGPRDPRAVLLAGVPSPEAGREAEALLAGLGLRVAGVLFPELDPVRAPGMGEAGAVVWLDPVGWEKIDDGMFLRRGLAVVRSHPPYGLAGTRLWLERAAAVLGLGSAAAAFEDALARRSAELEALAARARSRTIVLAGDPDDIELLTASGRAFGFSVAGLLCELGFGVRCLVWDGGDKSKTASLRKEKAAMGAGTLEFVPFSTAAQLDRALSRADLAFSHFNHDPRLEAHALPGFNDRAFEPGLEGMIRTGRLLLRRRDARPSPLFRRHLSPCPS